MSASRITRAVLVAAAVGASFVLIDWQRSADACQDSVTAVLFGIRDRVPDPELDEAAARVERDCEGSGRLVDSAGVLFKEGRPEQAEALLREAVEREPESFSAWAGLASVLARTDPSGSERAAERAKELNPRYRPPS